MRPAAAAIFSAHRLASTRVGSIGGLRATQRARLLPNDGHTQSRGVHSMTPVSRHAAVSVRVAHRCGAVQSYSVRCSCISDTTDRHQLTPQHSYRLYVTHIACTSLISQVRHRCSDATVTMQIGLSPYNSRWWARAGCHPRPPPRTRPAHRPPPPSASGLCLVLKVTVSCDD